MGQPVDVNKNWIAIPPFPEPYNRNKEMYYVVVTNEVPADTGLSTGGIIGLVIGIILAVLIIAALVGLFIFMYKRTQKKKKEKSKKISNFE